MPPDIDIKNEDRETRRKAHRIPYRVPILEQCDLDSRGHVFNITDRGVGIEGIEAEVAENKSLIIIANEFEDIDPIVFRAECKWAENETGGLTRSGFEITEISERNLNELRKLLRFVGPRKPCPPVSRG